MRGVGLAAALLIAVVPALVAATAGSAVNLTLALRADIPVADLDFTQGSGSAPNLECPSGEMERHNETRSFQFSEPPGGSQVPFGPRGCGTARWPVDVPRGAKQFTVEFTADRIFERVPGAPIASNPRFQQTVVVEDAQGRPLLRTDYFNDTEPPQTARVHRVGPVDVTDGAVPATVVWIFHDHGSTDLSAPGTTVASTVAYPAALFDGVAVPFATKESARPSGTDLTRALDISFSLNQSVLAHFRPAVTVSVGSPWTFQEATLPDGKVVDRTTTEAAFGDVPGEGADQVIVTTRDSAVGQNVTLAANLLARHGPGAYQVRLVSHGTVQVTHGLIPIAVLALASPFPFAAATLFRVATCRREAYGEFRWAVNRLQLGVAILIAGYLLAVVAAFFGDRLRAMASLPLRADALLMYAQAAAAIAGFVALFLVARRLESAMRPQPRMRQDLMEMDDSDEPED